MTFKNRYEITKKKTVYHWDWKPGIQSTIIKQEWVESYEICALSKKTDAVGKGSKECKSHLLFISVDVHLKWASIQLWLSIDAYIAGQWESLIKFITHSSTTGSPQIFPFPQHFIINIFKLYFSIIILILKISNWYK